VRKDGRVAARDAGCLRRPHGNLHRRNKRRGVEEGRSRWRNRQLVEGAFRANPRRRLCGCAGLLGAQRCPCQGTAEAPSRRPAGASCGNLPRIRAAVPALDRTGVQRGPEQRRLSSGYGRRCSRPRDPRARRKLRRHQGRTSARRLRRARTTRAARASGPPQGRRGSRRSRTHGCSRAGVNVSLDYAMQIGLIGLGRMGSNIVRRLMQRGHQAVVYDREPKAVSTLVAEGATGADGLEELVRKLGKPRTVWVMLPAGEITEGAIHELGELLEPGDIVIDGGNTFWKDDIRRAAALKQRNLHYVDVGTSGGVWGLERGYCMMIGGERDVVDRLDPIFAALAPGLGNVPRTPGRDGRDQRAE